MKNQYDKLKSIAYRGKALLERGWVGDAWCLEEFEALELSIKLLDFKALEETTGMLYSKNIFNQCHSICNILLGIMLLEFEDKNYLSGDNNSRNKEKRELVQLLAKKLKEIESNLVGDNND